MEKENKSKKTDLVESKTLDVTNEKPENNYMIEGLSVGMCLGMTIGLLFFDNLAIGMSLGMSIGLSVGLCIKKKK